MLSTLEHLSRISILLNHSFRSIFPHPMSLNLRWKSVSGWSLPHRAGAQTPAISNPMTSSLGRAVVPLFYYQGSPCDMTTANVMRYVVYATLRKSALEVDCVVLGRIALPLNRYFLSVCLNQIVMLYYTEPLTREVNASGSNAGPELTRLLA